MGDSAIWTAIEMRVKLYLGGREAAMKARIKALKEIPGDEIVYAGFEKEIEFMRSTNLWDGLGALSYDTVSNFRRRIDLLRKADRIFVATGICHWESILIIISKKFPELQGKVEWINSGEDEGVAGKVRLGMYKLAGPTVMEFLAKLTRPWKYWWQYKWPMAWSNMERYGFGLPESNDVGWEKKPHNLWIVRLFLYWYLISYSAYWTII